MKLISVIFVLLSYKNEIPEKSIVPYTEKFYNFNMEVVKDELPFSSYNKKYKRYDASKILDYLKYRYPGKKVVALTSYDIYTAANGSENWGIFGLGSLTNDVCVISTHRLKSRNLKHRVTSVVLHEIGHTYGLNHCTTDAKCLMKAGDHTAKSLDATPNYLCNDCKILIKCKRKPLKKTL